MQARVALAIALAVVLVAGGAAAHHGWSGYDTNKVLTLTGRIRESGYEHPHGFIVLETKDKVWTVVLAPPTRMENRGLPKAALAAGTTATVVGYPNRTDAKELRAERITIADKTTELR
jgi:hypothetical protein